MKNLMLTFWIALAATLVCGWLFLNLLTSIGGLVPALLLGAIVTAVLITLLRMLYQRLSDLQQRVEALERKENIPRTPKRESRGDSEIPPGPP